MDLLFTQTTEEQHKSTVVEDGGGNTSDYDDEGDAGDEAKGSTAAGDVAVVGWSMTLAGTEDRIRRGIDSQEDGTEESKGDDDERVDEEKRRRRDRLHNWPRAKPSKAKSDLGSFHQVLASKDEQCGRLRDLPERSRNWV
ncbi:hypothetical protein PsorP6_014457 [Peronosclerospora sorghi]|uniref:Uncharacterized protein n=1 Tax=Peronosclerospora sorghi TaxID=230839 RepID=A0ACC0VTU1_9STRA|nr:hypothetical protein PsorP6_014457 [Peronosclerospora sorghi]